MKSLLLCSLGFLCLGTPAIVTAQDKPDGEQLEARLRQDQQSILRKAERLRDLMKNLQDRFRKEQRQHEVDLLDKGLKHLDEINLMQTVAGVRDALDAHALSQANQKAAKVVEDLEALLVILLDRPSMEKIEEDIKKAREMEAGVSEAERRQTELLQKNRETSRQAASETERRLAEEIRQLARLQEEEANQTRRDAGTRQPYLENALRRVQQLQAEQKELEKRLQQRTEPDARDPSRGQLFEIGALKEETVRQMTERSRQRSMERVAEGARRLQQAAQRKDAADTQDAKDALRSELARAEKDHAGELGKSLEELLKKLEAANDGDVDGVAKDIEQKAVAAAKEQQAKNNTDLDKLAKDARAAADKMAQTRANEKQQPGKPEQDLDGAAKDLQSAADTGRQENQTQKTLSWLSQALRKLDEARTGVQQRNPSNETRAGKMASEAADAARELRESPGAKPDPARHEATGRNAKPDAGKGESPQRVPPGQEKPGQEKPAQEKPAQEKPEGAQPGKRDGATEPRPDESGARPAELPAENRAARELDAVEDQMRHVAEELRQAQKAREQDGGAQPPREKPAAERLQQTRDALDRAQKALESELRAGAQDAQTRQQSMQRQEQLAKQAQGLRDRMREAQEKGDLSREQQQAADKAMQQAQQRMQQAQESMRGNRQSQAAGEQKDASDRLEQAREEMARNRPLDQARKDALQEQAKEQKKLADDIMKLARLAEERKNQGAQRALDEANEKAKQAAEKLEQGESDEAEKKQEEARDALREARKELEEERQRYEDLRQEELLFKIQEELKQFLAKQEPITRKTEEQGKALDQGGKLSRRSRRMLNDLGDEEQQLQSKAEFMRKALEEEQVVVFSQALKSNEQDLAEVRSRLGGTQPTPDQVTVVLQKDVEHRTQMLIEALKREQRRRQQQRQQQQQQQQQQDDPSQRQKNNQNRQQRLVSIAAELEMLKQMEEDMLKRTQFMEKLVGSRGDNLSDVDLSLLERLSHRHSRITEIFLALKKQVEQALEPPPEEGAAGESEGKQDGKNGEAPKKGGEQGK